MRKHSINYENVIVSSFLFIVLAVFPLFYHDKYSDISQAKYSFFWISSLVAQVVVFGIHLYSSQNSSFRILKGIRSLKSYDYALLVFGGIALLSTLQSDYIYESFWGNEGRYVGLFLIFLLILDFMMVSKIWIFNQSFLDLFLIVGMAVCLLGILDFCGIDLLGLKKNIVITKKHAFTSTFGNINSYTLYVSMVVAVSFILFVFEDGTYQKHLSYFFCMLISMGALIMGRSDNAYLSLGVLFLITPLIIFRKKIWTRRYTASIATFLLLIVSVAWVNKALDGVAPPMDGIFLLLSGLPHLPLVIIVLFILSALLYRHKGEHMPTETSTVPMTRIWLCFLCLLAVALLFIAYDCNFCGNAQQYGAIGRYFVFEDEWGSGRGTAWRLGMEYFADFPLFRKLVGYGPETFGILMSENNMNLVQSTGTIFDNAHNEYLQLLVTVGIFGLLAYLTFIRIVLVKILKSGIDQPSALALFFAVICYLAQAVVNIHQPITAPFLWIFLAMGISLSRQINNQAQHAP